MTANSVHGSIWGPSRPRSYVERLKEKQELQRKERDGRGEKEGAGVKHGEDNGSHK